MKPLFVGDQSSKGSTYLYCTTDSRIEPAIRFVGAPDSSIYREIALVRKPHFCGDVRPACPHFRAGVPQFLIDRSHIPAGTCSNLKKGRGGQGCEVVGGPVEDFAVRPET